MPDADHFAALGLLDGLEGAAREERIELLQYLRDDYELSDEAMVRSTLAGTIVLAAAGRRVGTGELYSARDIARESGMSVELLTELVRASALPAPLDPDAIVYSETHLEVARSIEAFVQAGIQPEQMLNIARVLGRGLAQAADLMRQTVMELAIAPGVSEHQLSETYANASAGLAPMLGPLVEQLLRLHLHNAVRDEIVTEAEREAGELPGARDVTVAFADLVGFTKLGEQLPPGELEAVADRLVVLTGEIVASPVRLVKSVGDAVLLVSSDTRALLETALVLLDRVEAQGRDFPQVRIGLAHGPAVTRAGDWFGRPVNLASRITGVARAGSVVTDRATRDAIGSDDSVTWSTVGDRRLKGISSGVRLYRARRAETG
ncbi:MAG: adenylate cyclase regulatory domain-containing protein [Solirubrobacteraceae bacterium]|nr:adenylate cyclase regulatory domain-containing protein [Patulibacter sp.]